EPSGGVVNGDAQDAKGPLSRLHSKVAPGSSEEKAKVGVESVVSAGGPESIVVSGGAVSTVKAREAGLGSAFRARSVASTVKACGPSPSGAAGVNGDVQGASAAESIPHRKVPPGSDE